MGGGVRGYFSTIGVPWANIAMPAGIHDLDELHLRCRNPAAKEHIEEAIIAYKGGAFRSCIIATWIAVVYDFIEKLEELDLAGDKRAKQHLDRVEAIRAKGDSGVRDALAFEREVLGVARDQFELLTHVEYLDLVRIFEDRNRCAHPTFRSAGEKYQPSAELARAHLRHAVDILLSREPVQGKAALERIWAEVRSEYFPKTPEEARAHLATGPLARARKSLLRDVLVGLTKAILFEESVAKRVRQLSAALQAATLLHRSTAIEILATDLPSILASVPDENWDRVFLYFVWLDIAWDAAGKSAQNKARRFLATAKGDDVLLPLKAALLLPVRGEAFDRIAKLNPDDLQRLVVLGAHPAYCDPVVKAFCQAASFKEAFDLGENALLPVAGMLSEMQVKQVVGAIAQNSQIWPAWGIADKVLPALFVAVRAHNGAAEEEWKLVYGKLQHEYLSESGAAIRLLLEKRYPHLQPESSSDQVESASDSD